jgi:hypothetical protein
MCRVCSGTLRISLGINPCQIPQECTEYELPATFSEKLKTPFFRDYYSIKSNYHHNYGH